MADNEYYNAPGAAATDALQEYLFKQAQMKQQALVNSLNERKFAFEQKKEENDQVTRLEEQRMKREDRASLVADHDRADLEKRLSNAVPGDIFDPQMVQQMDKLGMGGQYAPKAAPAQQSLPGVVAPNSALVPSPMRIAGNAAQGIPDAQVGLTGTSDPVARPFIGNRADREKATLAAKVDTISKQMSGMDPNTPEFKVLATQYEMLTGKSIPAWMGKTAAGAKPDTVPIFTVDHRGVTKDSAGNVVTSLPAAHQLNHLTDPPDHSALDATNLNRVEIARKAAQTDITNNKDLVAAHEEVRRTTKLLNQLSIGSNVADSVLPEMVLQATAGGNGSGLRLNNTMIDQVLKGSRTAPDNLMVRLNAWGLGDHNAPLVITPDQRVQMRQLGLLLRKQASALLRNEQMIRDRIAEEDGGGNPQVAIKNINRHSNELRQLLNPPDDPSGPDESAKPNPAAILKEARGGK